MGDRSKNFYLYVFFFIICKTQALTLVLRVFFLCFLFIFFLWKKKDNLSKVTTPPLWTTSQTSKDKEIKDKLVQYCRITKTQTQWLTSSHTSPAAVGEELEVPYLGSWLTDSRVWQGYNHSVSQHWGLPWGSGSSSKFTWLLADFTSMGLMNFSSNLAASGSAGQSLPSRPF